jgi:hypothetical protein
LHDLAEQELFAMPLPILHEIDHRRPGWREGIWMPFGRHGSWSIPHPVALARPAPEAGGRLWPRYEVNGYIAEDLVGFYSNLRTDTTARYLEGGLAIIMYVMTFNYRLTPKEFDLLFMSTSGFDTFEALMQVVAVEPAVAMSKLLRSLPKVRDDRTGTEVGLN